MKPGDRELGMGVRISRRDLLHGVGGLAALSALSAQGCASKVVAPNYYPPATTGLRGSHEGSFEVAHALAREGRTDWGSSHEPDTGIYDLVVVGAGISGLTAAYYYRQQHPDARILILDNHDDFGGHAKRNEFEVGGSRLIGYGGSQSLEGPAGYDTRVKTLFKDLGVDLERFQQVFDQDLYRRFNMTGGTYFGKEQWGVDRLIPYCLGMHQGYLNVVPSSLTVAEAVAQFPISEAARLEFLELMLAKEDRMSHITVDDKWKYLNSISYREFLTRHGGITQDEVFRVLQDLCVDSCVGIEAAAASTALGYNQLPGLAIAGLEDLDDEPYIHHFPDGNAGLARMLVRDLIPAVARGSTMDDIVKAPFDYARLDESDSRVRLRLNSTVISIRHDNGTASNQPLHLSYIHSGRRYEIRARHCVLACYNAMIPSLCPELPQAQKEALAQQVKAPILYTNVALRNWRAWHKAGVASVVAPGGYHSIMMLDFPVSMGGYQFSNGPGQPIICHMERFIHTNNEGLTPQQQHRKGRAELLVTPFNDIERQTRQQLTGMLGSNGFDPAQDIVGITVNRWSHGYATRGSRLFGPHYEDRDDERWPHIQGRKPFGRITIANSDAGASASAPAAIEQALRAVDELQA